MREDIIVEIVDGYSVQPALDTRWDILEGLAYIKL